MAWEAGDTLAMMMFSFNQGQYGKKSYPGKKEISLFLSTRWDVDLISQSNYRWPHCSPDMQL